MDLIFVRYLCEKPQWKWLKENLAQNFFSSCSWGVVHSLVHVSFCPYILRLIICNFWLIYYSCPMVCERVSLYTLYSLVEILSSNWNFLCHHCNHDAWSVLWLSKLGRHKSMKANFLHSNPLFTKFYHFLWKE